MKYEIDVANQSLGRIASRIAVLLRGKHLPSYEPRIIPDIEVVVKNIEKIKFTGRKMENKLYYRYSGYPGGLKARPLKDLWAKNPRQVLRQSVYRMLPKNRSRDKVIKHLRFE